MEQQYPEIRDGFSLDPNSFDSLSELIDYLIDIWEDYIVSLTYDKPETVIPSTMQPNEYISFIFDQGEDLHRRANELIDEGKIFYSKEQD